MSCRSRSWFFSLSHFYHLRCLVIKLPFHRLNIKVLAVFRSQGRIRQKEEWKADFSWSQFSSLRYVEMGFLWVDIKFSFHRVTPSDAMAAEEKQEEQMLQSLISVVFAALILRFLG